MYNEQVDTSFRMNGGLSSQVMFFACLLYALWYVRNFAVLGLVAKEQVLGQIMKFGPLWRCLITNGPANVNGGEFELIITPYHLPLINTILLMASSSHLTIAHHALIKGLRKKNNRLVDCNLVILGATFLFYQAEEHIEAYQHLGFWH